MASTHKIIKLIFLFALAFILPHHAIAQIGAYKIIYSNASTHCYVTAVSINDSTIRYKISEKSDRKIWRLTDRSEVQSLGLLTLKKTIKVFTSALDLFNNNKLGATIKLKKNIVLTYRKEFGTKFVQIENELIGATININRKTAEGALKALKDQEEEEEEEYY